MIDAIKTLGKMITDWDWGLVATWVVMGVGAILFVWKVGWRYFRGKYCRAIEKAVNSKQLENDLDYLKTSMGKVLIACATGAKELKVLNKKSEGHNRRLLRIEKHLGLNGYGDKD
jgi:hypothetical protein